MSFGKSCSVSGRQVVEVSPSAIGGLPFAIAVSSRGIDIQKVYRLSHRMFIILLCHGFY